MPGCSSHYAIPAKMQPSIWHWKERLLAYHHGFGISPEGVLQQPCEFGVTVGHVGALAIHQCRDNIAQCGERQVDLSGFLQSLPCGSSFCLSFRTLQREHEAGVKTDPLIQLLPANRISYT